MFDFVEAEEKHSPLLQKFYQEQTVVGHVNFAVQRTHSFFDHYRLLSDDFSTVMLLDQERNIVAAATMTFVRAYVDRQEQLVAYISDLRVASQRLAIQQWANYFVPHFYKKIEEKKSKYVFTVIEQYESQAYNALLRPQKLKRSLPHYFLLRKMYQVFYLGMLPWAARPSTTIRVTHAWSSDIEEICEYLTQKKVGSPMFSHLTPEGLARKFDTWPQFFINNFLVARNMKNQIVGCMAPWNNRDVQQLIVKDYHDEGLLLYQTTQLVSPLRFMHAMPGVDKPASLKYITHCAVDNAEVFYSLMYNAYNETRRGEILVHTSFYGDYFTRAPENFFSTKVPYGFYTVLPPEQDLPKFLQPNQFTPPPDFNFVHL